MPQIPQLDGLLFLFFVGIRVCDWLLLFSCTKCNLYHKKSFEGIKWSSPKFSMVMFE